MDSATVRGITAVLRFVGNCFRSSIFGRILCRKESIDTYADTSVFYRGVCAVWGGICRFFGRIYGALRRVNTGSVNNRFFENVLQKSYIFHGEALLSIFICAIFIVPHDFWNNMYATIAAAILAVIYFLCVLSGRKDIGKNAQGLWFPFVLFIFATGVSVIGSRAMGDSIRVLIFFVTAFMMCLVVYGFFTSYEKLEKLLGFMVLCVGITACIAVVQRITGVEADASLTDMNLNAGMPGRVPGTLGNPNNYAEFLMLFIPFGFAWSLNQEKGGRKALGMLAVILGVVALLLTYSRSGWLAFAVAAVIFVALYNWKLLPILFIIGILCIPLLPESILNRILTIGNLEDSSSSYRIDIWTGTLRMLREGYWFEGTGLGAEAFTSVYRKFGVGESVVAPHSHMQFMEILAEMGIIGLVSLLWYSISLARRAAVHGTAKNVNKKLRTVLCAAAASVTGITAIGFAEYTWFYPRVMLAFFIAAGITMAAVRAAKTQK